MDGDVSVQPLSTARVNHKRIAETVHLTGFQLRELSTDIAFKTRVRVPPEVLSWLVPGEGEETAPTSDAVRAVAEYFGMPVGELLIPGPLTTDVEAAIDGAADLSLDDKAVLLHLYRRLRKGT